MCNNKCRNKSFKTVNIDNMLFQTLFLLAVLAVVFSIGQSADAVVQKKKNGPEPILNITLDGAIVGARLRCQGFLCPQWALDIGRYDYVQQLDTEFQYDDDDESVN